MSGYAQQLAGPAMPLFAREVAAGLTKAGQKELPSKYLYDEVGSALFEAISALPEYGLTRADESILKRNAHSIAQWAGTNTLIAELGSGSGRKTRWILEAFAHKGDVTYCPIDLSTSALSKCKEELSRIRRVEVLGVEAPYLDGLEEVNAVRRQGERILVLFLGSTIGNFGRQDAVDFLTRICHVLRRGDALLLGTDLVKAEHEMLLAYDDPAGVTAAFNLNLLGRINRELGGNFNLREFAHEVRYDRQERRIEMHLRARSRQVVTIRAAHITVEIEEGETIWTEACHKFHVSELQEMARRSGFVQRDQWLDNTWAFAESLWTVE